MIRARTFRRLEIALWFIGVCFLGVASAATIVRWNYQTREERALFQEPAPIVSTTQPQAAQSAEAFGPQAPGVPVSKPAALPPSDPNRIGRIEIPRLGVRAIIRTGSDEATLMRAVGLVPGSPRPGEKGNTVLAAHRDSFFEPLSDIQVNDRIRLVVPPHTYEYRVRSMRVVSPEEKDVLASKGSEELTLVTCYPFWYVGPAPDRFIVSAERVN